MCSPLISYIRMYHMCLPVPVQAVAAFLPTLLVAWLPQLLLSEAREYNKVSLALLQ